MEADTHFLPEHLSDGAFADIQMPRYFFAFVTCSLYSSSHISCVWSLCA
jgi:hypothetical protein